MKAQWSCSVDNDIWMVSHNALRKMVDDLCLSSDIICIKARSGRLAVWHLQYVKKYWTAFQQSYEEYYARKEQIIYPMFFERIELPQRLSFQNHNINLMIKDCKDALDAIDFNSNDIMQNVQQLTNKLHEFQALFRNCLKDEEEQAIATMYKCFSKQDLKEVFVKLKKDLKPNSYGWILYGFIDNESGNSWIKHILKPSFLTIQFIILPSVKEFNNTTRKTFVDLVTNH